MSTSKSQSDKQNEFLLQKIEQLEARVNSLETKIEMSSVIDNIIYIQEYSREEAKKLIVDYINTHNGPIYRHELSTELEMDLELVADIVDELKGEGFIHDSTI